MNVTVCIPHIHGRERYLADAVNSVRNQEYSQANGGPGIVKIASMVDENYDGPAIIRNRLVSLADTEWIVFLDDDDYLHPHYLNVVMNAQRESDADIVWPWFRVEGGTDPFPQNRGRQWDPTSPHIFPITTLVRREVFVDVGGFDYGVPIEDPNSPGSGFMVNGEDWRLWLRLSAMGARFHHDPTICWTWRHHPKNSSGLPERAKAAYRKVTT